MNKTRTLIIALLLSLLSNATVQARAINWYSGIGDNFLTADGVTLMDSTFSFELGGFGSGFTPDQTNFSLWQTNWVVFDSATTANGGWNPTPGISNYGDQASTISAGGLLVNSSDTGNTFTIGQQAYIWTFNSKSLNSGSEWSLISSPSWTFPAADSLSLPLDWQISDPGIAAVAGATSFDGGTFVSTLQTQAVPEPGSALLIAVAGVLIRLRRRVGR